MKPKRLRAAMLRLACAASILLLAGPLASWAQMPRINPEAQQTSAEARIASLAALLEQRPDAQGISQAMGLLANLSKAGDASKAEARRLIAAAAPLQKDGNTGEAKRRLLHAAALLLGQTWSDQHEFAASLVLRPDLAVADLRLPLLLHITQSFPARYSSGNLTLRLAITAASPRIATDVVVPSGKALTDLQRIDLPDRDLIDDPLRFAADLKDVAAGAYLLVADLYEDESRLARLAVPLYLAQEIAARRAAVERKLGQVKGSASTRATIRYPFELADALNARRLEITSFDFAAQMRRSEQLLDALGNGKDLLRRSKGDSRRNYWFAEAGEIMPYRLYVPGSWDGRKKLPLIIALHGGSLDENNMLDRDDGAMRKLAEQHGFIVASPLGYRINGGYGSNAGFTTSPATAAQQRMWQLSEQDVLNVTRQVADEYDVDRTRIYLMGNSMGAGGTWTIASRHGEMFAGLAPCASSMNLSALSFAKFRNMPVLSCVGELDTNGRKETAKFGIAKVKEISPHAEYVEVPGGTHGTGIQLALPQIFEFFSKYKRE